MIDNPIHITLTSPNQLLRDYFDSHANQFNEQLQIAVKKSLEEYDFIPIIEERMNNTIKRNIELSFDKLRINEIVEKTIKKVIIDKISEKLNSALEMNINKIEIKVL